MSNIDSKSKLISEILDFLISSPTLEQIIELHPSREVQVRLEYLLDQNRESALTDKEKKELQEAMQLNYFMSMLKAYARKKLEAQSHH